MRLAFLMAKPETEIKMIPIETNFDVYHIYILQFDPYIMENNSFVSVFDTPIVVSNDFQLNSNQWCEFAAENTFLLLYFAV